MKRDLRTELGLIREGKNETKGKVSSGRISRIASPVLNLIKKNFCILNREVIFLSVPLLFSIQVLSVLSPRSAFIAFFN